MYEKDIGKKIWSRGRTGSGVVQTIGRRYCAACQSVHTCYNVLWNDGTRTKPCTAGVKIVGDELEIM